MIHLLGSSEVCSSLYFVDDDNKEYVRAYSYLTCISSLTPVAKELNNGGNLIEEFDLCTERCPWFTNMKEIVVQFDKDLFILMCSDEQYEKYIKSEIRKSCLKYTKDKLLGTFDSYNERMDLVCEIAKNADKGGLKLKNCASKRQATIIRGVTYDIDIYYLKDLDYLVNNIPNNERTYLKRLIDSRHSRDCHLKPIYDTERQCLYSVDDYFREMLNTADESHNNCTVASVFYNDKDKTIKIVGSSCVEEGIICRPFAILNIETLESEIELVQVESYGDFHGVSEIMEKLEGVSIYSGSDKMGLYGSIYEKIY